MSSMLTILLLVFISMFIDVSTSSSCGPNEGTTTPEPIRLKTNLFRRLATEITQYSQSSNTATSTFEYQFTDALQVSLGTTDEELTYNKQNNVKVVLADLNNDGFDDFVIGTFFESYENGDMADTMNKGKICLSQPCEFIIGPPDPSFSWSGLTTFINDKRGSFETGKIVKHHYTDLRRTSNEPSNVNFTMKTFSANPVVTDIRAVDVDGDNYVDLIATWPEFPLIAWYRNRADGSGDFEMPRTISNTTRAYSLETMDVNSDGKLDVIAGSFGRESANRCGKVGSERDLPFKEYWENGVFINCKQINCTKKCTDCLPFHPEDPNQQSTFSRENMQLCDTNCLSIRPYICEFKSNVDSSEVLWFENTFSENQNFKNQPSVIKRLTRSFFKDDIDAMIMTLMVDE